MTNIHQNEDKNMISRRRVRFSEEIDYNWQILEADDGDNNEAASERTLLSEYNERQQQRRLDVGNLVVRGYGVLLLGSFEVKAVDAQKHLALFARLPGPVCGRGLELRVCKKLDRERKEWQAKCVQGVLHQYRIMKHHGEWNGNDDRWEILARVSREASQHARRFARRLGAADEYAVRKGDLTDMDAVLKLIDEIMALQMAEYQNENKVSIESLRRAIINDAASISDTASISTKDSVRRYKSTARRSSPQRPLKKLAKKQVVPVSNKIDTVKPSAQNTKTKNSRALQDFVKRWGPFTKLTRMKQKGGETDSDTSVSSSSLSSSGSDESLTEAEMDDDSLTIDMNDSMVLYGRGTRRDSSCTQAIVKQALDQVLEEAFEDGDHSPDVPANFDCRLEANCNTTPEPLPAMAEAWA